MEDRRQTRHMDTFSAVAAFEADSNVTGSTHERSAENRLHAEREGPFAHHYINVRRC